MAVDELARIKTALTQRNEREAAAARRTQRADHPGAPEESELAELQSLLSADPEFRKFGEVLRRRRDTRREALLAAQAGRRSEEQKSQAAAAAASAARIAARREALTFLAQPFTSSYVMLDEPFLIWELPHPNLEIFRNSQIESFGSWVKVLLDTKSSPGGPNETDFRFYFLWRNPSDYYAVANVSSSLSLNGQAVAFGSPGVWSGNVANLWVGAYLSIIRWSGWGADENGQTYDETPYPVYDQSAKKSIVGFAAFGGDLFTDAVSESKTFDPEMPYDVSARLILIPGRAVTLFEVGLTVEWWCHDGSGASSTTVEDDFQRVRLDLADNPPAYMARCPMVELEILTPPA
jgi:hypothetical protein